VQGVSPGLSLLQVLSGLTVGGTAFSAELRERVSQDSQFLCISSFSLGVVLNLDRVINLLRFSRKGFLFCILLSCPLKTLYGRPNAIRTGDIISGVGTSPTGLRPCRPPTVGKGTIEDSIIGAHHWPAHVLKLKSGTDYDLTSSISLLGYRRSSEDF
jgi:hypothetical protein